MSLRARVMALVALMLLVSVSVYVVISWNGARNDLAEELNAARTGGLQTVESSFEDLPRSSHRPRDVQQLVHTFDGNRHVSATVVDQSGHRLLASQPAKPTRATPGWFAALLRPHLQSVAVLIPDGSGHALRLTPEPASDIGALWFAALSAAGVFGIAALAGLALIYWVIGRALAPLGELAGGLGSIGAGAYRERVLEQGPAELRTLQRGFNSMAERLAETAEHNRALEGQLLTIQDEERAEIARDLHDEIGPYLFAVGLDAEMIGRCLRDGELRLIPDQVHSIRSAVTYMQRQVRDLIARLRPTRAAELGLEAAISDLVAFWRTRQPGLDFVAELDGADTFVPARLRDVIYRVIQESVANAVKHAETKELSIAILRTAGGVAVKVANCGTPRETTQEFPGLGIAGMRERVAAETGSLRINRGEEGWTVFARFPQTAEQTLA